LLFAALASAQSTFDAGVGFGTAHAPATGAGIENANSINAFAGCTPSAADPNCQATPSLGGFFLSIGGEWMLDKHYGFGAEVSVHPAKSDYGPLQYRQTFYDFNGVYAPVSQKRWAILLQGGIGGAKTGFSFTQSGCVGTAVCSTSSQPVGSTNHFQVHMAAGVQLYVTEHVYVRPEFSVHYIPNFTEQFGSNWATQGTIWLGYTLGDR
jgi:hypothetical protein